MKKNFSLLIALIFLSACNNSIERLKRVGEAPTFNEIDIPNQASNARYSEENVSQKRSANSLWQQGATTFFRDQRNWRVGDIIRVKVQVKDNAKLNNSSAQSRSGKDSLGIPSMFGKEAAIAKTLSKNADHNNLVSQNSTRDHKGQGNVDRKEDISTEIAAIVAQVLPNGNLLIKGRQEVRVNYELREITVAGIIRPKDISAENSINSAQMAEARISYGGRGTISDVQQPRIGSQVLDILSPF